MKKIGLDFDGVIADSGALKVEATQQMFGVVVDEGDFKKEILIGKNILTPEQYKEVQIFVYGDMVTGLRMKELESASESIRELQKTCAVQIVTSRSGHFADVARAWLTNQSLKIPLTETTYGESKKDGAEGCDVFVDDDLDKLEELIGHVPNLFLFSWPYNKDAVLPPEIIRVENWKDLMQKISDLN